MIDMGEFGVFEKLRHRLAVVIRQCCVSSSMRLSNDMRLLGETLRKWRAVLGVVLHAPRNVFSPHRAKVKMMILKTDISIPRAS